ncbi:hypothetical protein P7K49_006275 [Saguinus oedipus]|uniref:Uncharacterized protein n=1 Tax=Saguinus oedipus TaxID=9490 RepID=A0ABQ9W1Z3_SAGOE|nr:hypothetical protein P7K49_006275 [Saguinus oedipus]
MQQETDGARRRDTNPVLSHLLGPRGTSDFTPPCEKANILFAFCVLRDKGLGYSNQEVPFQHCGFCESEHYGGKKSLAQQGVCVILLSKATEARLTLGNLQVYRKKKMQEAAEMALLLERRKPWKLRVL